MFGARNGPQGRSLWPLLVARPTATRQGCGSSEALPTSEPSVREAAGTPGPDLRWFRQHGTPRMATPKSDTGHGYAATSHKKSILRLMASASPKHRTLSGPQRHAEIALEMVQAGRLHADDLALIIP